MIKSFKELSVWEKSHHFVLTMYNIVEQFPNQEKYRIVDQLLRASISIPTNIAEGTGRSSKKELIRYLVMSRGSAEEVKYLTLLAKDLDMLTAQEYNSLSLGLEEISKMLNGLINSLNRN